MLITAADKEGTVNTMTASWGMTGVLWNRPVAVCFIRPQRHTYAFAERSEYYTLSFFDESYRHALRFCGSKSGRDTDKFAVTGLVPLPIDGVDAVGIERARMILVCKKLYADNLREGNFLASAIPESIYPTKDFHRFFIGEIETVLVGE